MGEEDVVLVRTEVDGFIYELVAPRTSVPPGMSEIVLEPRVRVTAPTGAIPGPPDPPISPDDRPVA